MKVKGTHVDTHAYSCQLVRSLMCRVQQNCYSTPIWQPLGYATSLPAPQFTATLWKHILCCGTMYKRLHMWLCTSLQEHLYVSMCTLNFYVMVFMCSQSRLHGCHKMCFHEMAVKLSCGCWGCPPEGLKIMSFHAFWKKIDRRCCIRDYDYDQCIKTRKQPLLLIFPGRFFHEYKNFQFSEFLLSRKLRMYMYF